MNAAAQTTLCPPNPQISFPLEILFSTLHPFTFVTALLVSPPGLIAHERHNVSSVPRGFYVRASGSPGRPVRPPKGRDTGTRVGRRGAHGGEVASNRRQDGSPDGSAHDARFESTRRGPQALGESLPMISKLLGHRKVQTTTRYAHLTRDSVKASAARIAKSLRAAMMADSGQCARWQRDCHLATTLARARHAR